MSTVFVFIYYFSIIKLLKKLCVKKARRPGGRHGKRAQRDCIKYA